MSSPRITLPIFAYTAPLSLTILSLMLALSNNLILLLAVSFVMIALFAPPVRVLSCIDVVSFNTTVAESFTKINASFATSLLLISEALMNESVALSTTLIILLTDLLFFMFTASNLIVPLPSTNNAADNEVDLVASLFTISIRIN